jgi:hypothetical protein
MMQKTLGLTLGSVLLSAACTPPDPQKDLGVNEIETYWAVDSPRGDTQYIAPVVRFRLHNQTQKVLRSVDAQAGFRRVGEKEEDWASGSAIVATGKKPLPPGASVFVELKCEGRYSMRQTAAEDMLKNEGFRDAKVALWLREGNSSWTKMTEVEVDRRIGSKTAVIPTVPTVPAPSTHPQP